MSALDIKSSAQPLRQKILREIAASGPMPISQYMHVCNSHPQHGYYATGQPLGKTGDFVTAPEISQMFGELIAIWAIGAWQAIGAPNPVQIVEFGPGRATLMRDFIRTIAQTSNFFQAININLIETSATLKKVQKQTLAESPLRNDAIKWHETIDGLDPKATIFIANEFLDALPFRQFVKAKNRWLEVCVGIDANSQLAFVPGTTTIDEDILPLGHESEAEGAVFEYAPARESIISAITDHLAQNDGAALIIDYGHKNSGFGDTFQAMQAHKFVSTLENPGKSDLTSHVDFQAICDAATKPSIHIAGIMKQGEFLLKLGLLERASVLGQGKSPDIQKQIQNDVERLAAPGQMGDLFKVLCLTKHKIELPPFAAG